MPPKRTYSDRQIALWLEAMRRFLATGHAVPQSAVGLWTQYNSLLDHAPAYFAATQAAGNTQAPQALGVDVASPDPEAPQQTLRVQPDSAPSALAAQQRSESVLFPNTPHSPTPSAPRVVLSVGESVDVNEPPVQVGVDEVDEEVELIPQPRAPVAGRDRPYTRRELADLRAQAHGDDVTAIDAMVALQAKQERDAAKKKAANAKHGASRTERNNAKKGLQTRAEIDAHNRAVHNAAAAVARAKKMERTARAVRGGVDPHLEMPEEESDSDVVEVDPLEAAFAHARRINERGYRHYESAATRRRRDDEDRWNGAAADEDEDEVLVPPPRRHSSSRGVSFYDESHVPTTRSQRPSLGHSTRSAQRFWDGSDEDEDEDRDPDPPMPRRRR